ncbi:glycosyltransferase family 4 protein [Candidatus Azambacteria bacterium]|nr:glycosyltransferase family 4 protein [Candidatus Azambacteria bacterium]
MNPVRDLQFYNGMKLIYIANSRIPTEKANGFQIMKMCEAFSNAGVKMELWIPKRFNQIKESPFSYYDIRENFGIKKIPVVDLVPLDKLLGSAAGLVESVSFAFFCLFYLPKQSEDCFIYSRDQFICWFLSFSKRKFVYEIHSFPQNTGWYKRIWKRAYRIIAITQGLKNLLVRKNIKGDKILTAPDGVDLEAFNAVSQSKEELKIELGLPREDFLIGYVGKFKTLGMEKGIKTMIESLSLLEKDAKMVFVGGEESEMGEYKILASRFNVAAQCVFIAYQPYARMIKYIKAMDALVIPFPNEPHYAFYASPLKLFEYMASGQPIIASDLPALKEILNDKNALFFKPEDKNDLARAVKMLKASQTLGYHLSRQAFADVKNYTWQQRANNILKFININN